MAWTTPKTDFANGDVLTAAEMNAVGEDLAYLYALPTPSFVAGKNKILNGDFGIWQRGTSITATSTYSADRWFKGANAVETVSRQATSDSTNLPFIQYCARVQRNTGSSSTTLVDLGSPVETAIAVSLVGMTITLSYYARKGANYSAASSLMVTRLYTGTGTDQNPFASYTGSATPLDTTVTLTTTWQRFQHTITLGATVTEFTPYFAFTPVGTAGANDYFEVTGVQLEAGSVATPFTTATGNPASELAACQRYYFNSAGLAQGPSNVALANNTNTAWTNVQFPAVMRATPTVTLYDYSSNAATINPVGTITAYGNATADANQITKQGFIKINQTSANLSAGNQYWFYYTASAEL